MSVTPELLQKAKASKSVEELLDIARDNNVSLSEAEAVRYFEDLNRSGELADNELANVVGGTCYSSGVWGPKGYQKYAIVTAANRCHFYIDNEDDNSIPACAQCNHSFTAGATLYCEIRTEDNDPEK